MGEGVSARLRLVARSRHYAGRHFLSDRAEERCGAGALASGAFSTPVVWRLPIPVSGVEGGRACLPLAGSSYTQRFFESGD